MIKQTHLDKLSHKQLEEHFKDKIRNSLVNIIEFINKNKPPYWDNSTFTRLHGAYVRIENELSEQGLHQLHNKCHDYYNKLMKQVEERDKTARIKRLEQIRYNSPIQQKIRESQAREIKQ